MDVPKVIYHSHHSQPTHCQRTAVRTAGDIGSGGNVDWKVFEWPLSTILEQAQQLGPYGNSPMTGPLNHGTPGNCRSLGMPTSPGTWQ